MIILGIDPGKTGALVVVKDNRILDWIDMPLIGKEVMPKPIYEQFNAYYEGQPIDFCYIEKVNSFGMGRQSAFNFGQSYMAAKAAIMISNIAIKEVTPAAWKKSMGLNRDKDASRLLATKIFPTESEIFKRKKDDGRAEAALIALYGQQKESTTL